MVNHPEREAPAVEQFANKRPLINAPWIVLALICVFAVVHLWRNSLGSDDQAWFTLAFAFTPARYSPPANLMGFAFPGGEAGDIWTFVSHMFLHGDWAHLVINCVWMLIFGSVAARRLGTIRFLAFSALTAAIGAASHLAAYWGSFSLLVGASGAISGQMAGTVRMMFAADGKLASLNRPDVSHLPVLSLAETLSNSRALTFIVVWLFINLAFGAVGFGVSEDISRIAWEAHAGGFIGGLLLFGWFARRSVR